MLRHTKRSRTANPTGRNKKARHASASSPPPQPELQLLIGFDNPSCGNETERQADSEEDSDASRLELGFPYYNPAFCQLV